MCFLVGRNHLYSIDLKFSLQFSENTQLFLVFISHFQSSQEILNWELVASMFVLPPTRLDSHVKTVIELSEFHFMPSSPIFLLNHSNFTKSSTAIGIADCSLGYNTSITSSTTTTSYNNKVLLKKTVDFYFSDISDIALRRIFSTCIEEYSVVETNICSPTVE